MHRPSAEPLAEAGADQLDELELAQVIDVIRRVLRQPRSRATCSVSLDDLLPPGVRARLTAADRAVTTGGAPARLETLIDEQLNLGRVGLYAKSLACMESLLLSRVLEHARGNQSLASRLLGISRSSLRNKLHQLQIHIDPLTRVEDELVEDEAGRRAAAENRQPLIFTGFRQFFAMVLKAQAAPSILYGQRKSSLPLVDCEYLLLPQGRH